MSRDYSPSEVAALLAQADVQLIDVRTAEEHQGARIEGDRLIELAELPQQAATIDRERPVILYCLSGARSAMATQALAQAGFDAYNLSGGILAWDAAGLPTVPEGAPIVGH